MRLFVAIELPPDVRGQLRGIAESIRSELPPARWVLEDNLHLTLFFLGQRPPSDRRLLDRALRPVFAAASPFSLQPQGAGTFPPGKRVRAAWVGLQNEPRLGRLQAAVASSASQALGLESDRRPFRAHLTVARCRSPWPEAASDAWAAAFSGASLESFPVRRGVLMESRLPGRGGPPSVSYSRVSGYPLEGAS